MEQNKPKRKLYILSDSEDGIKDIDGMYLLVDDTGKVLYSHICSSKHFAMGDLIMSNHNRKKECAKEYGKFDVIFLGHDNMTLDKLVELHNKNYNNRG